MVTSEAIQVNIIYIMRRYAATAMLSLGLFVLAGVWVGCSSGGTGDMPITTSSDEAMKQFILGRDLQDNLVNVKARRHFRRAIKLDPEFALAYLHLSFSNMGAKGFFENLKLAKMYASKTSEGEQLFILAIEAGASGDLKQQGEHFQALAKLYPGDIRPKMLLANFYFGQQKYDSAVATYEAIVRIAPEYAPPYNMLGYSLRSLNKYSEAAEAFRTYIELIPDNANPYDSYAELMTRLGKFEEAITHYKKALEVDETFGSSRLGIAYNLMFLDRHLEAREVLSEGLELASNSAQARAALLAKAVTYVDEADYARAVRELENSYDLSAEQSDYAGMTGDLMNMAVVYHFSQQPDLAEAVLQKSLEVLDSSDLFERIKRNATLDIKLAQGLVSLDRSKVAEAKKLLVEFLETSEQLMNPFRVRNGHFGLGLIALAEKEYQLAISELTQANQEAAWTLYATARAHEASGDLKQAQEMYDKAATRYEFNTIAYAAIRNDAKTRAAELAEQLGSN